MSRYQGYSPRSAGWEPDYHDSIVIFTVGQECLLWLDGRYGETPRVVRVAEAARDGSSYRVEEPNCDEYDGGTHLWHAHREHLSPMPSLDGFGDSASSPGPSVWKDSRYWFSRNPEGVVSQHGTREEAVFSLVRWGIL